MEKNYNIQIDKDINYNGTQVKPYDAPSLSNIQ